MRATQKNPKQFTLARYEENAALQLIAFTGVTFIVFHFARVLFLVFGHDKNEVFQMMFPNIGLSSIEVFKHKFWTVFTYGLAHHGFWDWFSNMIWVYCFATVLQGTAGYRQVIPLFLYGLFFGGIFYLIGQKLAEDFFVLHENQHILGAYGGIMAIAAAALAIHPKQRLHFNENFSIPVIWIVVVYAVLTTVSYFETARGILSVCIGGTLTGLGFAFLLKKGYQPGAWIYALAEKVQAGVTPKEDIAKDRKAAAKRKELLQTYYEPTGNISQAQIDEILDKINEKGYYTLTREEKELLKKAGK
ncbi:MAG TPA: rhomboid family intramembrane serine protease [Flavipsychrobacter sp.]|nr:rhomboid family intramembrane serine protease [Flavipsychrobacter sp.]